MKNIAIVGDSFIDRYCFGSVSRLSPEAPVPVLDAERWEDRGGGAINVANNLYSMGIKPTLFTITNLKLPYPVISPRNCTPLIKTRFINNNYQLLRLDEPKVYLEEDLDLFEYPNPRDWDLIAIVDYDKGIITEGLEINARAMIVDSKKKNLRMFTGCEILKVNKKEKEESSYWEIFPKAFITKGKEGIDYFEYGKFIQGEPTEVQEVIDVTGAGDTVMASIIHSIIKGISGDHKVVMQRANDAAGKVIKKFGTSVVGKA